MRCWIDVSMPFSFVVVVGTNQHFLTQQSALHEQQHFHYAEAIMVRWYDAGIGWVRRHRIWSARMRFVNNNNNYIWDERLTLVASPAKSVPHSFYLFGMDRLNKSLWWNHIYCLRTLCCRCVPSTTLLQLKPSHSQSTYGSRRNLLFWSVRLIKCGMRNLAGDGILRATPSMHMNIGMDRLSAY